MNISNFPNNVKISKYVKTKINLLDDAINKRTPSKTTINTRLKYPENFLINKYIKQTLNNIEEGVNKTMIKIAIIYNSQIDPKTDIDAINEVYNDLYKDNVNIGKYDFNTTDQISITSQLEELYNQGYRNFVGFMSSNFLIKCFYFFDNHSDTTCFSTMSTIPIDEIHNNVFRPEFTDTTYMDAIKEAEILNIYQYNKIIILVEYNNTWADKVANIIMDMFNNKEVYGRQFTCIKQIIHTDNYNTLKMELDDNTGVFKYLNDETAIATLMYNNVSNFVKVCNESTKFIPTNDMYRLLFGTDGFFVSNLNVPENDLITFNNITLVYGTQLYGYGTEYNNKYNVYSALNLIDCINVINKNLDGNIKETIQNYIGINGPMTLYDNNTRKYGRIIIAYFDIVYVYLNPYKWFVEYLYENDETLGKVITYVNYVPL